VDFRQRAQQQLLSLRYIDMPAAIMNILARANRDAVTSPTCLSSCADYIAGIFLATTVACR
jgi:hypothetical protein